MAAGNSPRSTRLDRRSRGTREVEVLSAAEERRRNDTVIVAWIAFLTIPVHLAFLLRYGWSSEELVVATLARHLSWGYVEHPPLIGLLARAAFGVLGDGLFSLRIGAVLAGALAVFLSSRLSRELGGGRFAQVLTALAVATAAGFLKSFHLGGPDAWAILLWTAATLALVRTLSTQKTSGWIAFGALAGLGVESDFMVLLLPVAVLAVLPWTRSRGLLATRDAALGALCFLALLLPSLLWQAAQGWPSVEFLRQTVGPWTSLGGGGALGPVVALGPVGLILAVGGVVWLLGAPGAAVFRALAVVGLVTAAALMVLGGRGPGPLLVTPLLFAAGSVALATVARYGKALRIGTSVAFALTNSALAPLGLPVLPLPGLVTYERLVHSAFAGEAQGLLPPADADMMGWPELATAVRQLIVRIPRPDRSRACVVTQNQAQAGALEEVGRGPDPLPVVSGHNSAFLWGPGACDGTTLVLVGGFSGNPLSCRIDRLVTEIHCRLCRGETERTDIRLCLDAGDAGNAGHAGDAAAGGTGALSRVWPRLRHVD